MEMTIAELAKRLDAEIIPASAGTSGAWTIRTVGPIATADANTLTFLSNEKYKSKLKKSGAGAVIAGRAIEGISITQLVVKNVNAALIESLKIFAPKLEEPVPGIDPSVKAAKGVKIGKNVSIGPLVVIETGAEIGDETVVKAGCKIGQNTKIGHRCRLDCNVVIYHNCILGNNVIIQANSTIGSTGFGYAFIDGAHRLIPHNGIVVIEDFVEIGANSCIDRAKFGETRIGAGTKIDNLVQIAHNVVIGKCCLIVAQVGIAGSTKIGDGVVFGGQSGATDNIEIGNGVIVGARGCVLKSIEPGRQVLGYPAIELKEMLRIWAATNRLPKLIEQFRELCTRVEKLEATKDNK